MRGFSRCGDGVWELVMKVKNWKQTFHYDSPHWTSQASYVSAEKEGAFKLPGYWLRNFTRICVIMNFGANPSINHTAIVVDYIGQSLYSVMNKGIQKTWPEDMSSITTPINIDKSCLEKGLNMHGSSPWMIKSRVGVASRPKKCALPYMVRGVGIGSLQRPNMNCGEIIISYKDNPTQNYSIQSFPAFCKIYIQ
ncbi:uncharacterized skeletal organic matrix protein 5-like [Stylophora pistillata]|uniref:uncharacterized skeletal organic matrix protein 5-like n=1 Tax=Stylophora pistillata TaxID=50429 RepID=UPI000C049A20|nr:uncharacterized skeletal organic matrix protein 5-like [Stylophora pistillata]